MAAAVQQQWQRGGNGIAAVIFKLVIMMSCMIFLIAIMLQWNLDGKYINWEETICLTFKRVISVSVIFKKYTSLACDIKNIHVASV